MQRIGDIIHLRSHEDTEEQGMSYLVSLPLTLAAMLLIWLIGASIF